VPRTEREAVGKAAESRIPLVKTPEQGCGVEVEKSGVNIRESAGP